MAHVKGILLLYPSSLSQSPAAVHGQWAHAQLQPVLRSWRCKEWFGAALRPPCTGERVLAATCTTRNTRECPFLPLVLSSLTVILCLSHMLSGRGEKQPRSHCSFTRPSSRRLQAGGGTGGGRRGACGDGGWLDGSAATPSRMIRECSILGLQFFPCNAPGENTLQWWLSLVEAMQNAIVHCLTRLQANGLHLHDSPRARTSSFQPSSVSHSHRVRVPAIAGPSGPSAAPSCALQCVKLSPGPAPLAHRLSAPLTCLARL